MLRFPHDSEECEGDEYVGRAGEDTPEQDYDSNLLQRMEIPVTLGVVDVYEDCDAELCNGYEGDDDRHDLTPSQL